MPNQTQYRAPKWAIDLKKQYQYFKSECREDEAYGVFHAGRLALESEFACSFGDSTGFFQSELNPIESDDFGVVEPDKPKWTHVVHNSDKAYRHLTKGRLYKINDWSDSGGGCYLNDNNDDERFICVECCAHLAGDSWTLVSIPE